MWLRFLSVGAASSRNRNSGLSSALVGESGKATVDKTDNFAMFRGTRLAFHEQTVGGWHVIALDETIKLMEILRAGELALREDRRVMHDDARI